MFFIRDAMWLFETQTAFLGSFPKLWKVTISFIMSAHLSICMEQLSSHRTDFHEIWCFWIFWKSFTKIQVSLKSDKNKGYFTRRPIYSFYHVLLISSYNEKYFRKKCRENQNTHFVFSNFLSKIVPFTRKCGKIV